MEVDMDRKVSREEPVEKEKEETVINKYNVGKKIMTYNYRLITIHGHLNSLQDKKEKVGKYQCWHRRGNDSVQVFLEDGRETLVLGS